MPSEPQCTFFELGKKATCSYFRAKEPPLPLLVLSVNLWVNTRHVDLSTHYPRAMMKS